jgi:hypothetical protein
MKTGIIVIALVALGAGKAPAVDINPWLARSDSTNGEPAAAVSGDQLKALWGGANALNAEERGFISSDNGTKYDAWDGGYTWNWIMVKLRHTAKAHNFIGHWEAYTDAYADYPCKVYVWDWAEDNFDFKDMGPTGLFLRPNVASRFSRNIGPGARKQVCTYV